MASLNKVMLIGNAGRDAELSYTASGKPFARFSVAVNQRGSDGNDRTEWFNVTIFDKLAESVSQYITKGKQLYVEGRIQTREWTGDDGVKHHIFEVIGNTVTLLGSNTGESAPRRETVAAPPPDDDLPF